MNPRAMIMCKHGHTHRGPVAVRICEAAHRVWPSVRAPLELRTALREVVARSVERNKRRGT